MEANLRAVEYLIEEIRQNHDEEMYNTTFNKIIGLIQFMRTLRLLDIQDANNNNSVDNNETSRPGNIKFTGLQLVTMYGIMFITIIALLVKENVIDISLILG